LRRPRARIGLTNSTAGSHRPSAGPPRLARDRLTVATGSFHLHRLRVGLTGARRLKRHDLLREPVFEEQLVEIYGLALQWPIRENDHRNSRWDYVTVAINDVLGQRPTMREQLD